MPAKSEPDEVDAPPSSSGKLAAFQGQSAHKGGRRARQRGNSRACCAWTGSGCGRLSSSLIGSRSRSRCGVDGCAARCASTRRRTGTTASRSSRPGGISISASGAWSSAPAASAGVPGARRAGRGRPVRTATAPGSPATSSNSSPGWRPVPTRRRSPGWCGSTGTRSGGSSPACALMSSTATGWRTCSRSGSTRSSWKRQHNYLTLVADHIRGQIVWGTKGNDSSTAEPVLQAARQIALARDRGDLARHGPRLRQERSRARTAGDHRDRPVSRRRARQLRARRGPPRLLERAAPPRRP